MFIGLLDVVLKMVKGEFLNLPIDNQCSNHFIMFIIY
jgi:hypothetical protein